MPVVAPARRLSQGFHIGKDLEPNLKLMERWALGLKTFYVILAEVILLSDVIRVRL